MADISIANLPAFVGPSIDAADYFVIVDVSDTAESPLGTTKRATGAQATASAVNGPVNINAAANGDALVATYSGSGSNVGPRFRLVRTSATVRTWEIRVGIDGSYDVADVTAGLSRFTIATNGATSVNGNLMVTAAANVLTLTNTAPAAATNVYAIFQRGSNISTYFFANASDDFVIARGDGVASATINRLTGNWTFAAGSTTTFGAITTASLSTTGAINAASLTVTGTATVGSADGASHYIFMNASPASVQIIFQTAGTNIWTLGRGTNDGSNNFYLFNSGLGTNAMAVNVANNNVTFSGTVTSQGSPAFTASLPSAGYGLMLSAPGTNQFGLYVDGTGFYFRDITSSGAIRWWVNNAGAMVVTGSLQATAFNTNVGSAVAAAGAYTYLYSPDAAATILLGGTDPATYYNNTTHFFRSRSSVTYMQVQQDITIMTGVAGIQLNLNTAAGPSDVAFARAGSTKWRVGTNIVSVATDFLDFFDNASGLTALRFAPTSRQAVFTANVVTGFAMQVINTNTAPSGLDLWFNSAAPNNVTALFLSCHDNTPATRCNIRSNGGIENFQANNFNLSDATLKDVGALLDPHVWWDRLAALEIRAFKYLDQTHDDDNIGLIAQQVQAVAPELVDELIAEDQPPLLGVYTSDLFHAHIAVTQELQRRILALEAKLA